MTRGRLDKLLAVCVVACVLLAFACYSIAESRWFRGAMAGMAGAYAREIDPQAAPWAETDARRAGLTALRDSQYFARAGIAFLLLAFGGTMPRR